MCSRRTFLGTLAAASAAHPQARPAGPNVLVFLSDQESETVPRELLRLPNRERLEASGVRFTRAWCATPQCSPARGSLWTGMWPHRTGVVANIGAEGASPLDPGAPNIGHLFRRAGYRTGYFGKWHLSAGRPVDGDAYGFDRFAERGARPGDRGVVETAASWIGEQDEPWMAIVSIIQPHDIYQFPQARAKARAADERMPLRPGTPPPPSGPEDLATRPEPQRAYREQDQGQPAIGYTAEDWRRYRSFYYELIEDADRSLGVVLDALGDAAENTIVAYASDHGDGLGAHGLPFKGPFFYEELLNVPLVVSWPGRLRARVCDELVSQVDLLPTLADLAGVEMDEADGRSLRPALEGGSFEREELFAEYHSKQRWANPARIVRTRRWKLTQYLRGGRELYDLERDPHERNNLAGQGLDAEERLLERLDAWARRTADARWFEQRS